LRGCFLSVEDAGSENADGQHRNSDTDHDSGSETREWQISFHKRLLKLMLGIAWQRCYSQPGESRQRNL
jgi:hypothetical protein